MDIIQILNQPCQIINCVLPPAYLCSYIVHGPYEYPYCHVMLWNTESDTQIDAYMAHSFLCVYIGK